MKVQGIIVGKPAPDFEATTVDGRPFKLSNLRGKIVLLDFWATWCAPCTAALPTLKQAQEQYGGAGLVIVGVTIDRTAEVARKFVTDKQVGWTQVWAEKGTRGPLAERYGVTTVPATFLIAPDGNVLAKNPETDALLTAVKDACERLRPAP